MSTRNLIGDALAALDQSLAVADEKTAFDRDYWLQRAAVNAAVAQAQQNRVANLIAWKQLQATRAATADAGVGMLPLGTDETADEIEAALGIAEAPTPPAAPGITLTTEEAVLAAGTLRVMGGPRAMALAARLEAAT